MPVWYYVLMKDKNIQNEGVETPVVQPSNESQIPWWERPVTKTVRRSYWNDEDDGEEYILKRDGTYSRVRI